MMYQLEMFLGFLDKYRVKVDSSWHNIWEV